MDQPYNPKALEPAAQEACDVLLVADLLQQQAAGARADAHPAARRLRHEAHAGYTFLLMLQGNSILPF